MKSDGVPNKLFWLIQAYGEQTITRARTQHGKNRNISRTRRCVPRISFLASLFNYAADEVLNNALLRLRYPDLARSRA